jgi:hypothetical protein
MEGSDFVIEATMMTIAWFALRRTTRAPRVAIHVATLLTLLTLQGAFDVWLFRVANGNETTSHVIRPRSKPTF